MKDIRTILYPTDLSKWSIPAFDLACSLARDRAARLIVLHVIEGSLPSNPGALLGAIPPLPPTPEEQRAALRQQLLQFQPADPSVQTLHRLMEGDAATTILQVAEETACGLIVMGTHGRTGLTRLILGSVAEKVLRNAKCPVLVVRVPMSGEA